MVLTSDQKAVLLEEAFLTAREYAGCVVPRVRRYDLRIGCPKLERERREIPGVEGKRAFAHVGHLSDIVCMAWAAVDLDLPSQLGVIFHEFGHAIADGSEEDEADLAVLDRIGLRVEYGGPLRLQYLHPDDVIKVMES